MQKILTLIALLLPISAFAQDGPPPSPTPTPGAAPITDMTGRWAMEFSYQHISDNPHLRGVWLKWDAARGWQDVLGFWL